MKKAADALESVDAALLGSTPFMSRGPSHGAAGPIDTQAVVNAARKRKSLRRIVDPEVTVGFPAAEWGQGATPSGVLTPRAPPPQGGDGADKQDGQGRLPASGSASSDFSELSRASSEDDDGDEQAEERDDPYDLRRSSSSIVAVVKPRWSSRRESAAADFAPSGAGARSAPADQRDADAEWVDRASDALFEARCRDAGVVGNPQIRSRIRDALAAPQRSGAGGDRLDLTGCGVGPQAAHVLRDLLSDCAAGSPGAAIRVLSLRKNPLTDHAAKWLASLLAANHGIGAVDLAGASLGPAGLAELCAALPHSRVHALDLSSTALLKNCAGRAGIESLAAALAAPESRLREIYLGGCGPAPFALLAPGLAACATLEVLDLRRCGLDTPTVVALCRALSESPSPLRRLSLAHTVLVDQGSAALVDLVRSSRRLTYLNLTGCFATGHAVTEALLNATREGLPPSLLLGPAAAPGGLADLAMAAAATLAASFAQRLRPALEDASCALEQLVLDCNDLRSDAVLELAPALLTNTSLLRVSMVGCRITAGAAAALGQALASNGTLVELNLRRNELGDQGAADLVRTSLDHSGGSSSALRFLHLGQNQIGDRGALALATALRGNDSLVEMSLRENEIRDAGGRQLLDALAGAVAEGAAPSGGAAGGGAAAGRSLLGLAPRNNSLQVLDTGLNALGEELERALERALTQARERAQRAELISLRSEALALREDERKLVEVEAALEAATDELVAADERRANGVASMEEWMEQQQAETDRLAEELVRASAEAEQRVASLAAERRSVEHRIKEEQTNFMETSAAVRFKTANEKRKQYLRQEQVQKTQRLLEARRTELGQDAETERLLEEELAAEEREVEVLTNYVTSSTEKLQGVSNDLTRSCVSKLLQFKTLVLDERRQAGLPNHLPRHWNWRALPVRHFVAWLERGASGPSGTVSSSATAASSAGGVSADSASGQTRHASEVSRRYVGLQEMLRLRVRVMPPGVSPAPEDAIIMQRSHSVQSLAMHGLQYGSSVWISVVDESKLRRLFADDDSESAGASSAADREARSETRPGTTEPHAQQDAHDAGGAGAGAGAGPVPAARLEEIDAAGGTTVPHLATLVAERLGLELSDIKNLYYDPAEKGLAPPPTSATTSSAAVAAAAAAAALAAQGVFPGDEVDYSTAAASVAAAAAAANNGAEAGARRQRAPYPWELREQREKEKTRQREVVEASLRGTGLRPSPSLAEAAASAGHQQAGREPQQQQQQQQHQRAGIATGGAQSRATPPPPLLRRKTLPSGKLLPLGPTGRPVQVVSVLAHGTLLKRSTSIDGGSGGSGGTAPPGASRQEGGGRSLPAEESTAAEFGPDDGAAVRGHGQAGRATAPPLTRASTSQAHAHPVRGSGILPVTLVRPSVFNYPEPFVSALSRRGTAPVLVGQLVPAGPRAVADVRPGAPPSRAVRLAAADARRASFGQQRGGAAADGAGTSLGEQAEGTLASGGSGVTVETSGGRPKTAGRHLADRERGDTAHSPDRATDIPEFKQDARGGGPSSPTGASAAHAHSSGLAAVSPPLPSLLLQDAYGTGKSADAHVQQTETLPAAVALAASNNSASNQLSSRHVLPRTLLRRPGSAGLGRVGFALAGRGTPATDHETRPEF